MSDLKALTTVEVARLCRVTSATIKRWELDGLISSERTSGGHRRFRVDEVARFQREQQIGLKKHHGDETVLSMAGRKRWNDQFADSKFLRSLLDGNEEAATNILLRAYLEGSSLATVIDGLICPAIRKIGDLWCSGDVSITGEHLASQVVTNALDRLRNSIVVPETEKGRALCCGIEGDFHDIPTLLAQIVIENEGIEVINFGAATPFFSLAEEVSRYLPSMVCISASILDDAERSGREFQNLRAKTDKLGIPILLGGRVFDDDRVRKRFAGGVFVKSFGQVAKFTRKSVGPV